MSRRLPFVTPSRLLPIAVVALLATLTQLRAESPLLERLAGRELRGDSLSAADRAALDHVTGPLPKGFHFPPAPWHIWRTMGPHPGHYAVLSVETPIAFPGGSSACLQTFDKSGNRLLTSCFQTGWRMTPESASLEFSRDAVSELLVLHMSQQISGRDIARQYYAFDEHALRLIRLEDSAGKAFPAEFVLPNFEIGPPPTTATTTAAWLALLDSRERSGVLSALTFLGGRHLDKVLTADDGTPRRSRYAVTFLSLMNDPRIRERLEQHARSHEPWIREAALLALRPPTTRKLP